ncbi:MurR/RpiR family transcriptional regulator [Ostreiculturibacter nitratireducens]|uniref:MurR/RpiR family transcriptional regulator n=1 Tax=Ostreiculturibacter nitratireducens TaxID=3075226 RepID=UPI0031B5C397
MNKTNVLSPETSADILGRLQALRPGLTPELAKLAGYLLDHPNEIGISSIRQLAAKADVKPNTLVRLTRAIGLESYEAFREVFRAQIRQGRETYPDRARWLQSISQRGQLGGLYADSAEASIDNLEGFYAATDHEAIAAAAQAIVSARRTYALGVGVTNPIAQNFAYLAGMAIDNVRALPNGGTLPVDGLARAGAKDVLIAMTFRPYRREVVDAVAVARAQGVQVIAVSDGLACPIMADAQHRFIVPTETPQFFTSTVALTAFFEVLIAFVIAAAGEEVVTSIEAFHNRRHELGIYVEEA